MLKHWKRFSALYALAWPFGAATVTLAVARYAAEDFSLPDLLPMFLVLAVFGLLLAAIPAMPVLLFLRRRLTPTQRVVAYPLVSALLIAAPVAAATGLRSLVSGATATPLADGRDFIAGGYNASLDPTKQAWIYQPPGRPAPKLARGLAADGQGAR